VAQPKIFLPLITPQTFLKNVERPPFLALKCPNHPMNARKIFLGLKPFQNPN